MSICSVEGCGKKRHGHGLCRKHYHVEFKWKLIAWKKANPEKVRAHKRTDSIRNSKNIVERSKKWIRANPERRKAIVQKWGQENADQINARTAQRRATKLNATPVWADPFLIRKAYSLARLRTKVMGFKWHVDHVVPLQSKIVCGLHVEHNLRVIPAKDNRLKSNINWPDMPT